MALANPIDGIQQQAKLIERRAVRGVAYGVFLDGPDSANSGLAAGVSCAQVAQTGGSERGFGVMVAVGDSEGLGLRGYESEKPRETAVVTHLENKHLHGLAAAGANDVDARAVVVVDALPLPVDGGRGPVEVCLLSVLVLQPAVAKVELGLDLVVEPGSRAHGHRSTRLGRA